MFTRACAGGNEDMVASSFATAVVAIASCSALSGVTFLTLARIYLSGIFGSPLYGAKQFVIISEPSPQSAMKVSVD